MDKYFLNLAIDEAKKSSDLDGYHVGAVIVKNGIIISKAYGDEDTRSAHAEELAIRECKEDFSGAIMYVTMEPCSFRRSGKKSCCDLIIESGIKRIVYGALDPGIYIPCNGVEKLAEAEINIFHIKELELKCRELTPSLSFDK